MAHPLALPPQIHPLALHQPLLFHLLLLHLLPLLRHLLNRLAVDPRGNRSWDSRSFTKAQDKTGQHRGITRVITCASVYTRMHGMIEK
jgi:hypothetical protein